MLFQGGRVLDPAPRSPRKVPPGRKVRVLAVVHGWFPALAAGSERMMQHLLDSLPPAEFEVEILSFGVGEDAIEEDRYVYEGTPVHRGFDPPFSPDLIFVHHGPAARVVPAISAQHPHAPVVLVHHNDRYDIPDLLALDADLEVFNTEWVREALGRFGPVVHPPLEYDRHHVTQTGHRITLVNLQENKGVHLFSELAYRMPDFDFLGVVGTHGTQELDILLNRENIRIHPVTQDMREIWRKSRVVLMPSEYESYGMVAAEACASGIPVMANPTSGLVECLAHSGLFIPRDRPALWERALRSLLTDEDHYRERSALSEVRGWELANQSQTELSAFVDAVRKLVR
jgi:glycosyltransferase involved in cell wall biosynthesis